MIDSGFNLNVLITEDIAQTGHFPSYFGNENAEIYHRISSQDQTLKLGNFLAENGGFGLDKDNCSLGFLTNSFVEHLREIYDAKSMSIRFIDFEEYIDD